MNDPTPSPGLAKDAGIRVVERTDGGREFILPATRNFSEKLTFTALWLIFLAATVLSVFFWGAFLDAFPFGVARLYILNHAVYFYGVLGLIDLVLTLACLNLWFRSSRIIASPGRLRSVTHWLFFRREAAVAAGDIIEIRVYSAASTNSAVYCDIVVLTLGAKPGWLARNFPAPEKPRPGSSFTENDLKCFNSGGRKLHVATDIRGEAAAEWFAAELRRLLKLDNANPAPRMTP